MSQKNNFIQKAIGVHGEFYDYSKVEYVHSHTEVTIVCPKHGVFQQKPLNHVARKRGCNKCAIQRNSDKQRGDTETFIVRAKEIHGDKYTYEKANYVSNRKKVIVNCVKHGEFHISPASHIDKRAGCMKCVKERQKLTFVDFVANAQKVHGDKYTYKEESFSGSKKKMDIVCPKHGVFQQTPSKHLTSTFGCHKCIIREKLDTSHFIEKAKKLHGDKYDYTNSVYLGSKESIEIWCNSCKEYFTQKAETHYKCGCPKCGIVGNADRQRKTTSTFIEESRLSHGDKYDYSLVDYKGANERVKIICPEHGEFEQLPYVHSVGGGCFKCGSAETKNEDEIADFLSKYVEVVRGDRKLIAPKEIDILIPSLKIAIEFNGVHWHSERYGKDRNYHLNKTLACREKGYRLIHIFEDDYKENSEMIKKYLLHVIGKSNDEVIYGRKTTISKIDNKEASIFLDKHHIQGKTRMSFAYGLFYQGELVSVTSFVKGANNTRNKGKYELIRHATKRRVIGALGKAIKQFERDFKEKELFTFCDDSFFSGESYLKAGFKKIGSIPPDYKYVIRAKREHKFNWRLDKIKAKLGLDGDTEKNLMEKAGYYRIWDCGKTRYGK